MLRVSSKLLKQHQTTIHQFICSFNSLEIIAKGTVFYCNFKLHQINNVTDLQALWRMEDENLLGLTTTETRRIRTDVILVYKKLTEILTGLKW